MIMLLLYNMLSSLL